MASEIQPLTIEPEFYLQPTDTIVSLKPPSASTVCRLLNQLDAKKATGLDRSHCKLLKLSSSIIGPSLAYIFKSCIDAEIFPNEWKIAKVTPVFKKGSKRENNLVPSCLSRPFKTKNSQCCLRNYDFEISCFNTTSYGKHTITHQGPYIWSKSSKELRTSLTLITSRRE